MFWGIPLTTKINNKVSFRVRLILSGVENDALILQMRSYDRKRLTRKVTTIAENEFVKITEYIKQLI